MKTCINHLCRQIAFAITAVLIASLGSPALADDFVWDPGTSSWDVSTNWNNLDNIFEPTIDDGTIPDGSSDTATIFGNPDPQLFSNRNLGNLTLQANGDLLMSTFNLTTGTVLVTDAGSTLSVEQGFLDTDDLTLASGGLLTLAGGTVQMDNNGDFGSGTFVSGHGVIKKGGTSDLMNRGRILASGGTLTIERNGGSSFLNWSGTGTATELEVASGATMNITIPTGIYDYRSLIDLNGGTFNVTNDWNMWTGSTMEMNGNNSVTGAHWTIGSDSVINVNSGSNTISSSNFRTFPGSSIIIAGGATLNLDSPIKTINQPTSGTYTVDGTLRFNNDSTLSSPTFDGVGLLDFNSGTATGGGTFNVVTEINGTVNVVSSLNANRNINVDGGNLEVNSNATFNLASGRTLTASNNGVVNINQATDFNMTGETINLFSGSSLTTGGAFIVGSGGSGTLLVDGSGSVLQTGDRLEIAVGDNTGVVGVATIRNSASAIIGGDLHVARINATAATNGTFNVQSDADVTVNGTVRVADASGGTGAINVTGSGSTLTQTGVNSTIIGRGGGNTATMNIADSGRYTSGTMNVRGTGTVNVNTNGDLDVNGGLNINGGGVVDLVTTGDFNWANLMTMNVATGGRFTHEDTYNTPDFATINVVNAGSLFEVVDPVGHNSTLTVNGGTQLFVSAGGELAVDYLFVDDGLATINGTNTNLDATSGTIAGFRHNIGAPSDTATLRLSNSATGSLESATPTRLEVGVSSSATGLVEVLSDADLTLQNLEINDTGNGTSGVVNVDGSGSKITQVGASTLDIGASAGGVAELNLTNSGDFFTGTGLTTVNATGVVDVVDSGSVFDVNGDINVTGGTINSTGTGLNLAANKTLTASANGQFNITGGTHSLGVARTYQITDGADMSLVHDFYIGNSGFGNATVIIDGVGSTLTTNTTGNNAGAFVGLNGTGVLTVRNDAQATFTLGPLNIADSGNDLSNGTVNIESGADATANSIEMATSNRATSVLNVDGAGSTVTQTSGSLFKIGSAGTSSATVNVTNNGRINTGDGTTTLGANGVINVNTGGEINIGSGPGFLASGGIDVRSGGTLNGNGTVNANFVFQSDGTVAPGLSIGTLTLNSSYSQRSGSAATLEIEINNTGVAGTDYDLLAVAGNAFPRATLDLQLDGGYTPTVGDEFDFMTVVSVISGSFDTITNVVQPSNLGLAVRYGHDPNQIDMRVTLMGDTNFDNDVDVFQFDANGDAQILSSNLGTGSGMTWSDGDFNGDADVDVFQFDGQGDAQLLSSNLGASADVGADQGPGFAEALYNPLTGEFFFHTGGNIAVMGLETAGLFIVDSLDAGSIFGPAAQNDGSILAWFNPTGLAIGEDSVGFVLPPGLMSGDINFSYTPIGGATVQADVTFIAAIPEPSSMLLLGMGLVGLAGQRRRSA